MSTQLVVVCIYFVAMLIIGFLCTKATTTQEDYVVAGRKLPLWVNVNTLAATAIGAGSAMGTCGRAYNLGYDGIWSLLGYTLGMVFMGFVLAQPLWRSKGFTLTDVVRQRYGSRTADIINIMELVKLQGVTCLQMLGLGAIGQTLLGWDKMTATLVMGGIVICYTVSGGLWAVALTDVVQMILDAAGLMVILPFLGLKGVGGWVGLTKSLPPEFFRFAGNLSIGAIFALFLNMITTASIAQELWVRCFASDTVKNAKRAMLIAGGLIYLPHAVSIVVIGMTGRVLFPGIKTPSMVLPTVIMKLTSPLGAGILISALLAAVMSCTDSVLLVTGSNVSRNIYMRYFNKKATDQQMVFVSRISVVVVGILGIIGGYYAKDMVTLSQDYTAPISSLFPIVIAGFYWKRANHTSAMAAVIVGVLAWFYLYINKLQIWGMHPLVISMFAATVAMVIAGLLTKPDVTQAPSAAD